MTRRLLLPALLIPLAFIPALGHGAPPKHQVKHPAKPASGPARTRAACRKIMQSIALTNQAHMIRTGSHDYTTDVKALEEEAGEKFVGKCPSGGKYTITINSDSTFTVHCSIKEHESNPHGRGGYTPPAN